jgi:hypothetical protein
MERKSSAKRFVADGGESQARSLIVTDLYACARLLQYYMNGNVEAKLLHEVTSEDE